MAYHDSTSLNLHIRVRWSLWFIVGCFSIIVLRLWYLQILRGDYFRNRSLNNRSRTVFISPPRGYIKDRNGTVLVKNRPSFDVELIKEDARRPGEVLSRLEKLLGYEEGVLNQFLRENRKARKGFEPQLLIRDVDREVVASIMAHKYELPGIVVSVTPTREYVRGDFGSHILGYIREISADQLRSPDFSGYRSGDLVGQSGVEKVHEYLLHGKRGIEGIIVNASGIRIGESYYESERSGHNVFLTIDADLQAIAESALEGVRGAIVALDPKTGEVLALTSKPAFNPNLFTEEISSEDWHEIVHGSEQRMTSRAVQGLYPPGSLFKIFVAIAGVAEGVVTPTERVSCMGSYRVGRSRPFHCHKREGHGSMNLKEAIKRSCNVYFFTIGQRLGVDRINRYASMFGLGETTGLELMKEPAGLVPSTEWKRRYFSRREDQRWYPGETPSVSIGQGAITTTPLQLARAFAAIANGGQLLKPHIVKKIQSHSGKFKEEISKTEVLRETGIDPEVLTLVKKGLFAVVNEEKGTGSRARLDPKLDINVAGKTGTAQLRRFTEENKAEDSKDLAWFAGYAPAEDPEILVVALVEEGGHGGVTAAPISKALMESYFSKEDR